jgi:hypothetical protein
MAKPLPPRLTHEERKKAVFLLNQQLSNAYAPLVWVTRVHPMIAAHPLFPKNQPAVMMVKHACIIAALVGIRAIDAFFGDIRNKKPDDIQWNDFANYVPREVLKGKWRPAINKRIAHLTRVSFEDGTTGMDDDKDFTWLLAAMLRKATPEVKRFLKHWAKEKRKADPWSSSVSSTKCSTH